jgi:hypothetical protein
MDHDVNPNFRYISTNEQVTDCDYTNISVSKLLTR